MAHLEQPPMTPFGLVLSLQVLSASLHVEVYVPLCDSALIACGKGELGDPRSLAGNLYWGAHSGAERFLSRAPGFRAVSRRDLPDPARPSLLRTVELARAASGSGREVRVVLHAYAGERIDDALADFLQAAGGRGSADLVVWAGHDRLMDVPRPVPPRAVRPRPAAVLACVSEPYFRPVLDRMGVPVLALTRTFMAPEAYLLEALVASVAQHGVEDKVAARQALIEAYARYQRISPAAAATVFSRLQ
jgi:hypothetical protein